MRNYDLQIKSTVIVTSEAVRLKINNVCRSYDSNELKQKIPIQR